MTRAGEHRVVIYLEAGETGGVTGMVRDLILGDPGRAFRVLCPGTPSLRNWAGELPSSRVQVRFLAPRKVRVLPAWAGPRDLLLCVSWFRTASLLHVHQHTPFSCLSALLVAAAVSRAPIVATEHYITQLRFLRRRPLPAPLSLVREARIAVRMLLKSASLRAVTRIVCVSSANRDVLVSSFPRTAAKTQVIANGIDTAAFGEEHSGAGAAPLRTLAGGDSGWTILVVAGLNNQKGHRYLLQAVPEVLARHPGARFVLVGEGHLRSELEALAKTMKIDACTIFAGRRADVPALLTACDLVVLPSLFEGMPLSILEAMAAGKAVVATRVDGTKEAVVDGVTGLLVPPGDPHALAVAINDLLTDDHLRAAFGARGRERARKLYDRSVMGAAYERLYQEVLAGGPGA